MNFQQLRSVRETVRCGFNLTEVAAALHTSQPGISRQIRELEDELGIEIFARAGKRLTGLTPPGEAVLAIVERLLLDACNLKRAGAEFAAQASGPLSIATTHTQARYALPAVVRDFRQLYPQVTLNLHQGTPKQVAEMLLSGEADIGVATEALAHYEQLVALPCYRWTHSVVVPPGHELLTHDGPLTLQRLARHPIITYDLGYTGRRHIDEAFARVGLTPSVVLTAMDADVIKTRARHGRGHRRLDRLRRGPRPRLARARRARAVRGEPDAPRAAARHLAARLCLCVHRSLRADADARGRGTSAERRGDRRVARSLASREIASTTEHTEITENSFSLCPLCPLWCLAFKSSPPDRSRPLRNA